MDTIGVKRYFMSTETINIIKKHPSLEESIFLHDRIDEFNAEATKNNNGVSFARLIYDENNSIIAGRIVWTWAGACEVDVLWVHKENRVKGYGRLLLESAEEEAYEQHLQYRINEQLYISSSRILSEAWVCS